MMICHKDLNLITNNWRGTQHIVWIPRHKGVIENEEANNFASETRELWNINLIITHNLL